MCGRYTLATDLTEFLELLSISAPEELATPHRFNIAPSQPVLAVVADPRPRVEVMEWGYIPSWAKPESKPRPVINARVETIAEKPYFRGAFRSSRCAILADGFYEWRKEGKEKHPYRITLRDGGVFAMAGLWSWSRTNDGSERPTCAIITTGANALMESIHDRMPAILRTEDLAVWLDPVARQKDLMAALEPYPSEEMRAYEVSTIVNSPGNDTPSCILPVEQE
jgi:putative SOS response-associated peptidase YedK